MLRNVVGDFTKFQEHRIIVTESFNHYIYEEYLWKFRGLVKTKSDVP
jgi:hypothetical protein